MKKIPLTKGFVAMVDDADYEWLSKYKWTTMDHPCGAAAYRKRNKISVFMHREIVGALKGEQVDHKDRNRLNNTRSNLRICSSSQNHANSTISSRNTSGFKGLRFQCGKWEAHITINRKWIYLGRFKDKEKAAAAYDKAAKKLFGEFALTNQMLATTR